MTRAYAPLLEPLGLTYPQYIALLALSEEDGVSVKRLGERLSLDSGTLTPLLKRLEETGLVERHRDREDEASFASTSRSTVDRSTEKRRVVPTALACRVVDVTDARAVAKLERLQKELEALVCQLEKSA